MFYVLTLALMGCSVNSPTGPCDPCDTGIPVNTDTGSTDTGDCCPDTDTPDPLDVDDDGDGFTENQGDCDDALPSINPVATDIVGDAVDQNCDGVDGTDVDGDGFASEISGGDDCDDTESTTYPGNTEIWYDGIDNDCDDATVDDDQDGDGFTVTDDCDDTIPSINPAATDIIGDGFDQNCDGMDGTDFDGDGFASVGSGGDDCDDTESTTYPGAPNVWYDGLDANCSGNDFDQDGDGYGANNADCDDLNPLIHPNTVEVIDGTDGNCDGVYDNTLLSFADSNEVQWDVFVYSWDLTGEFDILRIYDDRTGVVEEHPLPPLGGNLVLVYGVDTNISWLGWDGDLAIEDIDTGICHTITKNPMDTPWFTSCIPEGATPIFFID